MCEKRVSFDLTQINANELDSRTIDPMFKRPSLKPEYDCFQSRYEYHRNISKEKPKNVTSSNKKAFVGLGSHLINPAVHQSLFNGENSFNSGYFQKSQDFNNPVFPKSTNEPLLFQLSKRDLFAPSYKLDPFPFISSRRSESRQFLGLGGCQVNPTVNQSLLSNSNTLNPGFLQKNRNQGIYNRRTEIPRVCSAENRSSSIHDEVFKMMNKPHEKSNLYHRPWDEPKKVYFRLTPSSASSLPQPSKVQQHLFKVNKVNPKKTLFNGLEPYDESLATKLTLKPNSKRLIFRKQ